MWLQDFSTPSQQSGPFRRGLMPAWRLAGLHSVTINLSYRITLELLIRDRQIIPINVGDHDAVY